MYEGKNTLLLDWQKQQRGKLQEVGEDLFKIFV